MSSRNAKFTDVTTGFAWLLSRTTHSLSISLACGCLSFLAVSTSKKRFFSRLSASPRVSQSSFWCFKVTSLRSFSPSWWEKLWRGAVINFFFFKATIERGLCISSYLSQKLLRSEDVFLHHVCILLHLSNQHGQVGGLDPAT